MKRILLISFYMALAAGIFAQAVAKDSTDAQKEHERIYNENIKLTKLNGVFIPGTLKEAFRRIKKLTPPDALDKFKAGQEEVVCPKIHYGIGRWMIENWNFYNGSRFSHYLKKKGILHPDDMAQFVLRTFHRHLNDLELNEEAIITELETARKKMVREMFGY